MDHKFEMTFETNGAPYIESSMSGVLFVTARKPVLLLSLSLNLFRLEINSKLLAFGFAFNAATV